MKTTIKTLAAALLAGVLSISNVSATTGDAGNKSFAVGMYQVSNSLNMRVAINKTAGTKVNITLKDAGGNVIYSAQVAKKESTFRCNVDMSELTDGKYQFSISDGITTETKDIVIGTKKPEPVEEQRFISLN